MTASSPSAARAAVDELEGLLAKATPGEWRFRDETYEQERDGGAFVSANVVEGMWDIATCGAGSVSPNLGDRVELSRANARLIASMHRHLPHLLAAIKAVDELAGQLDDLGDLPLAGRTSAASLRAALALAAVDVTETADGAS